MCKYLHLKLPSYGTHRLELLESSMVTQGAQTVALITGATKWLQTAALVMCHCTAATFCYISSLLRQPITTTDTGAGILPLCPTCCCITAIYLYNLHYGCAAAVLPPFFVNYCKHCCTTGYGYLYHPTFDFATIQLLSALRRVLPGSLGFARRKERSRTGCGNWNDGNGGGSFLWGERGRSHGLRTQVGPLTPRTTALVPSVLFLSAGILNFGPF